MRRVERTAPIRRRSWMERHAATLIIWALAVVAAGALALRLRA
jgi:hypothetical protein